MDTPNKIPRPVAEDRFLNYFLTECYQGPNQLWIHKCGNQIRMRLAFLSIHNTSLDGVCGGSGKVEKKEIPFCPRCEPAPQEGGCLHDLGPPTVTYEIMDSQLGPPIMVWRFDEAPEEYRKLSPHGGDEDWLALLPPSIREHAKGFPDWLETPAFGVHSTSVHEMPGGFWIVIGAHS